VFSKGETSPHVALCICEDDANTFFKVGPATSCSDVVATRDPCDLSPPCFSRGCSPAPCSLLLGKHQPAAGSLHLRLYQRCWKPHEMFCISFVVAYISSTKRVLHPQAQVTHRHPHWSAKDNFCGFYGAIRASDAHSDVGSTPSSPSTSLCFFSPTSLPSLDSGRTYPVHLVS